MCDCLICIAGIHLVTDMKTWRTFDKIVKLEDVKKSHTMRKKVPKLLDLLIFCIDSLNFSLEFFIVLFFVTNQQNISKFLPAQIRKILTSY